MKILREKAIDDLADVGRDEAPAVHLHVFAVLQRRDDGRVGRWPADAMFLECFDKRGFGEARRRLGEVLLGFKVCQRDRLAFLHRRQDVIVVVRVQIVGAFLVDRDIPGCDEGGAVRTQDVALGAIATCEQIDGDRVKDRVTHLAGDRALPDERI